MTLTAQDRQFLRDCGIAPWTPRRRRSRSSGDPTLDFLKANGLALTRENYFTVAYFGAPPKDLDAESEANLPGELGQ